MNIADTHSDAYVPPRKSLWERTYRPIMYIIAFACVFVGTVHDAPLELNVSSTTAGVFDTVENIPAARQAAIRDAEERLEALRQNTNNDSPARARQIREMEAQLARLRKKTNGVLLICFDFDPGTAPELQPMAEAIMHHAFRNNITVLGNVGFNINSAQLAADIMNDIARRETDEYDPKIDGVDYVFFGFRPNAFMLFMQMGENIIQAYETDYAGNDLNALPVMDGILNYNEIEMVVTLTGYVGGPEMWMNVAKTRFGRDVGLGMTAVSAADYYPYVQSGQAVGLLAGLRGAAEYESAIGVPGDAIQRMRPQLYTHTFALALLLLGNAESLIARLRRKKTV